jgi:hypothetical protein
MVNFPVRCHFCLAIAQAEATSARISFSRSVLRHVRRPHDSQLYFKWAMIKNEQTLVTFTHCLWSQGSLFRALDDGDGAFTSRARADNSRRRRRANDADSNGASMKSGEGEDRMANGDVFLPSSENARRNSSRSAVGLYTFKRAERHALRYRHDLLL